MVKINSHLANTPYNFCMECFYKKNKNCEKAIDKLTAFVVYLRLSMPHGEVVELVYGTSLENWRAFVAYRGFESHPLRQHFYEYCN